MKRKPKIETKKPNQKDDFKSNGPLSIFLNSAIPKWPKRIRIKKDKGKQDSMGQASLYQDDGRQLRLFIFYLFFYSSVPVSR